MDADRFDALSRTLAAGHTRRRLTRLLGSLGVVGVLSAHTIQDAAAALRNGGRPCTTGSQCKTGRCLKNGRCSCNKTFPTCLQPTSACRKATCNVDTHRCVTKSCCVGNACERPGCTCAKRAEGGTVCIGGVALCSDTCTSNSDCPSDKRCAEDTDCPGGPRFICKFFCKF